MQPQSKAAIGVGSRYGEKDMDNMSQKFRNEELPETWCGQFFEKYKATKPYRVIFGDRDTDKRTPELMSNYILELLRSIREDELHLRKM